MATIDLTQIKNVINDNFYPLLGVKDRYLIERGGRGAGKSREIAHKILLRIIKAHSTGVKHKFLCLRKTQPDVRRSLYDLFVEQVIPDLGVDDLVKSKVKTPACITFKNGSKILFSGLDDHTKLKSIVGITGAWMEEATEFSLEDFMAVDQIIRGRFADYFQIILSFNPTTKDSWIYKQFYSNIEQTDVENNPAFIEYPYGAESRACLHLSTYKDNRFLNSEYGQMLESYVNTSPYHYQVHCLGEWGVLGGLVYENWETISEMPSAAINMYGLDFGYSNDPTAVVKVWKEDRDYYVQEKLYKHKMTNDDLINWLLTYTEPNAIVYCDSAEPARIESLKRAGIGARPCTKGKWSKKNGILYIKEHNLKIIGGGDNLRKEITGYTNKKKHGEYIDEPIEVNDHLMDAMRYPLFTHWFKKSIEPSMLII